MPVDYISAVIMVFVFLLLNLALFMASFKLWLLTVSMLGLSFASVAIYNRIKYGEWLP